MHKNKLLIITIIGLFLLISCTPKVSNTISTENVQTKDDETTNLPDPEEIEKPIEIPNNSVLENSLYSEYKIVTLLPFDAIQAIDNPVFLTAEEADSEYSPSELVMGVTFNGVSKAYSINLLSRHEIVNDTVGGIKLSATW